MAKVRITCSVWTAEGPSCQSRFIPAGMRHIKTYFPSDPRDDYWVEFEPSPVEPVPVVVEEDEAPKDEKKTVTEEYLNKKRRGR